MSRRSWNKAKERLPKLAATIMISNYLSIDVEDYFQVSAFEKVSRIDNWDSYESRVERNTGKILEILDKTGVKATFFIVGWIAERHGALVKKIFSRGHQIGCHSHLHRKVYDLSPEQFRQDTKQAKETIEDIVGQPVLIYRAPSYSITKKSLWALDILAELGFKYDSSIFPIHHDIYGIPDAPRFPYAISGLDLLEFPITTFRIFGRNIPIAGGGYFRFFPYWFTRTLLRQINSRERQPFVFYLHPWELDPDQPRMHNAGLRSKTRHYLNLKKTSSRLQQLLKDFHFIPISAP